MQGQVRLYFKMYWLWFHLYEMSQIGKSIQKESGLVLVRVGREQNGERLPLGMGGNGNILKVDSGEDVRTFK